MTKRTRLTIRQSCVSRLPWLALTVLSLRAATPSTDDLIRRVEAHYNSVRTLSVRFEETYDILGHRRPVERGTLALRKQGKMRWDYTEPAGKLFVSDGKTLYLFTAGDNRVEKAAVRDTEDTRAPLAFLLGHLDLKKEFRNFQMQTEGGETWLNALPKSDRVPYQNVSMLIRDDGSIERLRISSRDGSSTAFVFTDEKVNPPIEEQLFHFQIPAGAEVVNAVEFGAEGK